MNSVKKNNDGHTSFEDRPKRDHGITKLYYHMTARAEVIKSSQVPVNNKEAK
jgi:hypothetical protein